jgi:hypothetical protein
MIVLPFVNIFGVRVEKISALPSRNTLNKTAQKGVRTDSLYLYTDIQIGIGNFT